MVWRSVPAVQPVLMIVSTLSFLTVHCRNMELAMSRVHWPAASYGAAPGMGGTRDGAGITAVSPGELQAKVFSTFSQCKKPKVFLHVRRFMRAPHVSSQHNSDDRSFSKELNLRRVCQKEDKNGIKQFPTVKCHIDRTSIFGKASVNFNILFCFLKISTTQKMSKYVILTFSEPNVLSLHS